MSEEYHMLTAHGATAARLANAAAEADASEAFTVEVADIALGVPTTHRSAARAMTESNDLKNFVMSVPGGTVVREKG